MYRIESILVPVDLSSFSRAAWEFALSIPGEERPTVQLAHAVAPLPAHVRDVLFPYAPLGEDDVEFEHEMLEAARARYLDAFDIPETLPKHLAEPRFELGRPDVALPEIVRTSPADLVVMGAFGESGVYHDAIGSLPERLLRAHSTPVFLARDFDPKPTIQRILVATDLTRSSNRVFEVATGLALAIGASVETAYVLPDPMALDTNNVLRMVVKFDDRQAITKTKSRVDALFDRLHDSIDVPLSLKAAFDKQVGRRKTLVGEPASAILERAEKANVDLIVVGTQRADASGKSRFGSVAERIIRRAQTHVLVVPVDPEPGLSDES